MRRRILAVSQLCLGIGIIVFILAGLHRHGDLAGMAAAIRQAAASWPLLIAGFTLIGMAVLFCTRRWGLVLRSLGHELPFGRAATLYLVGQFFNAFLLGATGGDIVKAYYAAMETKHRRTEIVTTVFIDRLAGLMALLVLTAAVVLTRMRFFMSIPPLRAAAFVYAAFIVLAAPVFAVFFLRNIFERWPLLASFETRTRLGAQIGRVYRSFRFCLHRPALMTGTFVLSLANHVCAIAAAFYFGMALGLNLRFEDYLATFLVINAIASIPVTPSGLGTRETACILMLGAVGVPASVAVGISLMLYAAFIGWSLVGGVVYVFYSSRHGRVKDVVREDG